MAAQSGEGRILQLIQKAKEKSFEARRVKGHVIGCDERLHPEGKVYAVHIMNGSLCESFWLADQAENSTFHPPLRGDRVEGTVNTFDDAIEFADFRLEPIFDFVNHTAANEEAHFAWFREQERLARAGNPGVSPVYMKNWKP
jgi:hypothetical protein